MSATFVDAFAGAGGLSLGLHQAGLTPLLAFDNDPVACRTLARNLPGDVRNVSIADLSADTIVEQVGVPDVVVGGPPCQGFSTQRRGPRSDSRNDLVEDYFRFALAVRPRVIVMENVPGVLGQRGLSHMREVERRVREAGYEVAHEVIDLAGLGVPQRRRRALVVAWDPTRAEAFDFGHLPRAERVSTVHDAIGDLPEPPDDFSEHPDYANHVRVRMSDLNLERISHVPPGGGRLDLPRSLQMACHLDSEHRHLDVFGRLRWDAPAGTITAMFDNFTRGRFAHPAQDRNITNREGARLQTFPDSYVFEGAKKQIARQIGNAVPPRFGRAIGLAVLRQLGRATSLDQSPAGTDDEYYPARVPLERELLTTRS